MLRVAENLILSRKDGFADKETKKFHQKKKRRPLNRNLDFELS